MDVSEVYCAIKYNDCVTVKTYLDSLTNITQETTKKVDSFLFYAIQQGQLDIVKLIVCYHGNPETNPNWAIILAKLTGNIEIWKFLVKIPESEDC